MPPRAPDPFPDTRKPERSQTQAAGSGGETTVTRSPFQPDTETAIALAFLVGFASAFGASSVYRRFFKRIKNAEWVTPDLLARQRWITGVVTRVGDADNFRLYHTPGFGWRGPFKFRRVPTTSRELRGKTIHIRMAGMDAPEASHFGNPAMPYSAEALAWLKDNVEGRRIKCQLLRRDQYQRVVALPLVPRRGWGWTRLGATRNLPLEMVRAGWGFVYTQRGAEYGGWEKEVYLAAEAEAQAARRGIWQGGTDIQSPAEYKKRLRSKEERVELVVEPEDAEPEVEKAGFLRRIFGRFTSKPHGGNTSV